MVTGAHPSLPPLQHTCLDFVSQKVPASGPHCRWYWQCGGGGGAVGDAWRAWFETIGSHPTQSTLDVTRPTPHVLLRDW